MLRIVFSTLMLLFPSRSECLWSLIVLEFMVFCSTFGHYTSDPQAIIGLIMEVSMHFTILNFSPHVVPSKGLQDLQLSKRLLQLRPLSNQ